MIRLLFLAVTLLMTSLEMYVAEAHAAGCPADQVRNLVECGIVLQPRQLLASAAARMCDYPDGPTKVGFGGARGGGKSHWALAQCVCDDMKRYPGLKGLYLRKVGKAGKEAVQDLRREVLHSIPHTFQNSTIELANESKLILGHFRHENDIDSYLGLQYDFALVEEATQLTKRKRKDIGTCVRSSKPGWRPRQYYTTNPGGIGHGWFKEMFINPLRRAIETDTRFIQSTVRDNRFVNPEYRAELEGLTGWQRRAWLEGDWDIASGQYFTTWSHEHHVISSLEIGSQWPLWLGFDYGFTHNTYAPLLTEDDDRNLYIVDEHCRHKTLIETHCSSMQAMLDRHEIEKRRIRRIAAGLDCFSSNEKGGTIAKDYSSLGWVFHPANVDRINGAATILKLLGDPLGTGQPPRLFVHERCTRLIECLPYLVHDENRPEDVLKVDADEDGQGGDDPYDGFRYGVMDRSIKPPGPAKVSGQRKRFQGSIYLPFGNA